MTQIERLVKIYLDSMKRLQEEVKRRQAYGTSTYYQEELIRAIDRELKRLNLETNAWADEAVKAAYERGARLAVQAAQTTGSVRPLAAFGGLNVRAAELLAHNTQDFLQITNSLIARQAQDTVRKVGVEVTAKKFAEMLTVRETRKLMETRLMEEGFGARVPWRNGRGSMRTDSYAELVARTTTAEATNTGCLDQMREQGQVLVKLTAHNTTCKVCAPRQGRVYRTVEADQLPEGDPRREFPHIREGLPRWPTYKTIHPNCAHRVLPYIWTQKTKEEQEDALRQAKKPFNLDPRGEAERLRYEKVQRENAERLRNRKQWERYKAVLGDQAPKTFSGFRAMKRAGSENFRFMSLDYKRQSRLAANPALALPNAGKATAADAKFTSYIFSPSNPDGLAKGVAFTNRLGYDSDNWEELRDKILKAAPRYPTRLRGEDENGASFEQKIILWGLKGKPANVIVGWKTKDSLTWMTTAYISEVKFDVDD